jgi:hypothetical protein
MYAIYYAQKHAKMDYCEWDYHNATVKDFSIQLTLTEEVWNVW